MLRVNGMGGGGGSGRRGWFLAKQEWVQLKYDGRPKTSNQIPKRTSKYAGTLLFPPLYIDLLLLFQLATTEV